MEYYQQGDVLIKLVVAIPSDSKQFQTEEANPVLARGEVTGHAHRVVGAVWMFRNPDGEVFMKAPGRITIVHEEHRTLQIPPGIYKIEAVREYDHFAEEARQVRD